MDVQKRQNTKPLATKEQVRLAQLTQTSKESRDDNHLQKLIKRVIEVTGCDEASAHQALLENSQNPDLAVDSILQNPLQNSWNESKSRKTKKQEEKSTGVNGRADNSKFKPDSRGFNRNQGRDSAKFLDKKNRIRSQNRDGQTSSNEQGFQKRDKRYAAKSYNGKTDELSKKDEAQVEPTKWDATDNSYGERDHGWSDGIKTGYEDPDDWKNLPRVYTSSMVEASTTASSTQNEQTSSANANSWPTPNEGVSENATNLASSGEPLKKSFAAIVATKKNPPPILPNRVPVTNSVEPKPLVKEENIQDAYQIEQSAFDNGKVDSWDNQQEWASSSQNNEAWVGDVSNNSWNANSSPIKVHQSLSEQTSASNFSSSIGTLSINKKLTEQLKNDVGLLPSDSIDSNKISTHHQMYLPSQKQSMSPNSDLHSNEIGLNSAQKVEFVAKSLPQGSSTNYTFGFDIGATKNNGNFWASPNKNIMHQPVSSVELDSVLKDNSTNALGTTASLTDSATITSSASAQFLSTHYVEQATPISSESARGHQLTFSGVSSVDYPSSEARMSVTNDGSITSAVTSANSNYMTKQQQQVMSASGNTMPSAQQQQQIYQATAPHQFPNYPNIPTYPHALNVYSPVAAHGMSDLDRFLMQQIPTFATMSNAIDMPFNALSMSSGQPTMGNTGGMATASHQQQSHQRSAQEQNTNSSYMDVNKFQHQSSLGGNSSNGMSAGGYQQQAVNQQQRNIGNVDNSIMNSGGSVVAPPPGFGMPQQPAYIPQHANVGSLFQMPAYPAAYPPSFMYANRMQTQGRVAQTSPPENLTGIGGRPLQMQPSNRQRQEYGMNEHQSMNAMQLSGDQSNSYANNFASNKRYNQYNIN